MLLLLDDASELEQSDRALWLIVADRIFSIVAVYRVEQSITIVRFDQRNQRPPVLLR